MSVFINPLTDTGFKIFFGKEGLSEEFLMDFLNQLFKGDPELGNIVSLTYRNVERVPETMEEKTPRYDIHCQTNTGHHFIVEMQRQKKPHFLDRVTYYMARGITDQATRARSEGEWNYSLIPVVGVFLADFSIDGLEPKLLTLTREMDVETGRPVGNKLRRAYIQLKAFNKTAEECTTGFEKWIYILKNMETMSYIPFRAMNDAVFSRLAEVSRVSALSEEDRITYERDLKWARDYNAEMSYARSVGREEGLAEGKAEEKVAIARQMKALGIDASTIAKATGLKVSEIEAL